MNDLLDIKNFEARNLGVVEINAMFNTFIESLKSPENTEALIQEIYRMKNLLAHLKHKPYTVGTRFKFSAEKRETIQSMLNQRYAEDWGDEFRTLEMKRNFLFLLPYDAITTNEVLEAVAGLQNSPYEQDNYKYSFNSSLIERLKMFIVDYFCLLFIFKILSRSLSRSRLDSVLNTVVIGRSPTLTSDNEATAGWGVYHFENKDSSIEMFLLHFADINFTSIFSADIIYRINMLAHEIGHMIFRKDEGIRGLTIEHFTGAEDKLYRHMIERPEGVAQNIFFHATEESYRELNLGLTLEEIFAYFTQLDQLKVFSEQAKDGSSLLKNWIISPRSSPNHTLGFQIADRMIQAGIGIELIPDIIGKLREYFPEKNFYLIDTSYPKGKVEFDEVMEALDGIINNFRKPQA